MLTQMLVFLVVAVLLNVYAYRGIKSVILKIKNTNYSHIVKYCFLLSDVLFLMFSLIYMIIIRTSQWDDYVKYRNYFFISGAFALIYFPRYVFVLFVFFNDVKIYIYYLVRISKVHIPDIFEKFYKSNFLLKSGLVAGMVMLLLVFHGIVIGKHSFQVERVDIYYDDLPESFDGLTIAHFSDTHLGSFSNHKHIIRGIEKINALKADIVVFSGDLINNDPAEAYHYIDHFRNMKAGKAKFSVLGNHDLGDYRRWYMIDEKQPCISSLEILHKQMGFKLLRNQHEFIYNDGDSIMIAGVDNWGLPPFEKSGDISKALYPYSDFNFILLLSHDSTHWDEEVVNNKNIRLTFSGHTHGLQIGLKYGDFSWSLANYLYKRSHGLYEKNNQYLYINRGFGFVALPMRIGMLPEITLITLRKK